ncbi:MAG: type II secretion system F family protein [Pirellulaceae bacterium]
MFVLPVALAAVAIGGITFVLADIVTAPRPLPERLGKFEVVRRERLREASNLYRWFEPWVDELASSLESKGRGLDELQRHLIAAGVVTPWRAAEFLAVKQIEGIAAAIISCVLGLILGGWSLALITTFAGYYGYPLLARRHVRSEAIRRQLKMKRRFAAVVDLMALILEVGAGFQEALFVAAEESKGHPLGDELALVRRDINMGKRDDALRNFARRVQDDDVSEFVAGVIEGEKLGTPLAQIFRVQAEQMRQKRSQWAEKAAAESEVALVFPAMLIMVACLIIVAAPFVLTAIFNPGG